MFKNLLSILSGPCTVVELSKDLYVYPIFKNGRSSIKMYAEAHNCRTFTNESVSELEPITVYIRNPLERFASGVNTYLYYEHDSKLDQEVLSGIEKGDIVNKHFVPQYVWLLHLYKYYKGPVQLELVDRLYEVIPNRDGPWTENPKPWIPLSPQRYDTIMSVSHKNYVRQDQILIDKYLGRTTDIDTIMTDSEFKDVLS